MRAILLSASLLAFAAGCPPREQQASTGDGGPKVGCTSVGQSCTVAQGKLGTCVRKDDCADPAGCFVCQSQH